MVVLGQVPGLCVASGRVPTYRQGRTPSSLQTKVRGSHEVQGAWRAIELDIGDFLASEHVEEELARFAGDPDRIRSSSSTERLPGRGIAQFEPAATQPTAEEPGSALDVVPQRLVHGLVERAGRAPVGAAHVLMVNEHLVEVGDSSQPAEAEDPPRA